MRFVNRETIAPPAAFSRPSAQEGRRTLLELFSQDTQKLAQSRGTVFLDEETPSKSEEGMRRFRPIDFAIAAGLSTACFAL